MCLFFIQVGLDSICKLIRDIRLLLYSLVLVAANRITFLSPTTLTHAWISTP